MVNDSTILNLQYLVLSPGIQQFYTQRPAICSFGSYFKVFGATLPIFSWLLLVGEGTLFRF